MLNIIGLRRSGNHAIIPWVCAHFRSVVFYNAIQQPLRTLHNRIYHWGAPVAFDRPGARTVEIASYEDVPVTYADRPIVIVRSFYNMAASRIAGIRRGWGELDLDVALELWPEHAKAHTILYDQWFTDPQYRMMIEIARDWPARAANVDQTTRIGWGSSFGQRWEHDGGVLKRYETAVADDPMWAEVLACEEARDLNARLFGWTLSAKGEYVDVTEG